MAKNYYRSGDNNLTCDVCGRKIKASESRLRWDGFQVCRDDWEERQPQDFVRARADKISVPVVRPMAPTPFSFPVGWEEFLNTNEHVVVTRILDALDLFDNYVVTDVIAINKANNVFEEVILQEIIDFLVYTERNFDDTVTMQSTGSACFLDYVDPTYFLEVYVGTCTGFNT